MPIELTDIEANARDEIPETFDALIESKRFGANGLARRKRLITAMLWGRALSDSEEEALDPRVQAYAGKLLAKSLIGPGIDYWTKQQLSRSAGTIEQVSFDAQRVVQLEKARDQLTKEIADLLPDVQVILPPRQLVAGAAPRVEQAGKLTTIGAGTLYTPDPFDLPPVFGPPDDTTTSTSA